MKYPITPDYIKSAPDELVRLYEKLEAYILMDICERFKYSETATNTAIEQIRELQRRGYSLKDIETYIKETLKLTDAEYDRIMQDALERNITYYNSVSDMMGESIRVDAINAEINAIIAQTKGNLDNLTQSMGFAIRKNGQVTYMPIAQAYQQVLSDAEIRVWSGTQDYNTAIRQAVKELADSGIRVVDYSKDGHEHHDHADVAARRAVMTGITQLSSRYSEQAREDIPTPYMEITAHVGARDTVKAGVPWSSHKEWQGKVYSVNSGDKYQNVYAKTGWGEVDGLEGANCRHLHYPYWDGVTERTYTDEQLKNIDPPPFEYQGQKYTAYQATQKQRQVERALRKVKRELIGFKASGDNEAYTMAAVRYRRLNEEYTNFSKAAGLREQRERANIAEFTPQDAKQANKASMGA